jgi:N4-gp56 family major capsid protein
MAITTGGLTATMATYYSKLFLERAKLLLKFDTFAQRRGIPKNGGKVVNFTKHIAPAVATTGLTEAVNPSGANATAATIAATLVEYGSYTQISSLYDRTSIDVGLEEQVSIFGQNAGESMDTIIRVVFYAGGDLTTPQYASGNSTTTARSNLVVSDIMNTYQLRRAVRTLKVNRALPVIGALGNPVFGGLVGPQVAYDLFGDAQWQNAQQYVNPDPIKRGILGTFAGVEWVETNNIYTTALAASSVLYQTFIMGDQSLGVVTIDSEDVTGKTNAQLIIKEPGRNDTGNPLDMFSTIGWKAAMAPVVLDSSWIISIYTAASA